MWTVQIVAYISLSLAACSFAVAEEAEKPTGDKGLNPYYSSECAGKPAGTPCGVNKELICSGGAYPSCCSRHDPDCLKSQ